MTPRIIREGQPTQAFEITHLGRHAQMQAPDTPDNRATLIKHIESREPQG